MELYIPTLGRKYQETFDNLPSELQGKVIFVQNEHTGVKGIAATRQWIVENAKSNKVVMLDDDLVFATRRQDDPTKFQPSTNNDILRMFSRIESALDTYAHVGVSTREGGNRDISEYAYNCRLLRILCYRVDVLRDNGIRFDRILLMEDFDVTLQLLRKGYPNVRLNWIVHNQRSSNAPGGCSTYRTLERQQEAAFKLAELHSEFVDTVVKKTKTAWNGQERTDVRIQWKAAFDSAGVVIALDNGEGIDSEEEGTGFTETME